MKKILLCCLLLISGCAQETIEGEQIIGYAEYCINEDCSEKKQIRLEKRHQETIQNYFDESVLNDNYHYNEECARLIMIDLSSNTKTTYIEYRSDHPSGYNYVTYMPDGSFAYHETPLIEMLASLDAEEMEEEILLNPSMPEGYSVLSYRDTEKTDPLYLLLYADQEDFKNQKLVLAGIAEMAASQKEDYGSVTQEVWDNYIFDDVYCIDVSEAEDYANTLIDDFHWPEIETCFLGSTLQNEVYYDAENQRIILQQKDDFELFANKQLIPLSKKENTLTVATVSAIYDPQPAFTASTAQIVLPNGTKMSRGFNDLIFDMIYDKANQLNLFEVTLQDDKISAIKKINEAEIDAQPITADQFVLHENGDIQVYTLENDSISAWVFNHQIQEICEDMQVTVESFSSNLSENDSLILVNLSYDKNYFRDEYTWIFDKQEGRLIDIGTLNEKYFDGKMNEIALKKINEKMPVCSVNYDENREIEQCAVPLYFAEEGNQDIYDQAAYPFYFNEQNELCIDINIRSYGSYSDTMTLRFEM